MSVLDPHLYPVALVALALLSLVPARDGRAVAARNALLLAVAALDFWVTRLDLDPANVLRVQVPGALFFALAAASGVDRALALIEGRSAGRPGRARALSVALLAATSLSALPCLAAAFQRTNEDEEEAFVRAARAALPPGRPVLVRLGYGDVEGSLAGSPVHLYFPDYLFSLPGEPRRVRDIVEWERDPTETDAYFYLGVRCYTPERPGELSAEARREPIPMRRACREVIERWGDGPVVERDAPNHGDPLATGYYDEDRSRPLHLALIRLRHR